MGMSEIDREAILGERLEEMQRIIDKREVDKMFKEQKGGDDNVAKAAKRLQDFISTRKSY